MPVAHRIGARPGRESPPNLGDLASETVDYRVDVPDRYNPVIDSVESWAAEEPEALALIIVDEHGRDVAQLGIGDVADAALASATVLLELGVGPGDTILLATPREPEWHALLLGAIRIGAVPVPLPTGLAPTEIVALTRIAQPAVVLADARSAAALDAAPDDLASIHLRLQCGRSAPTDRWADITPALAASSGTGLPAAPTDADDLMAMVFTRGATGTPKLVAHRQSWVLGHIAAARFWLDLRPGDLHWTLAGDASWTPPWAGLLAPWHERSAVLHLQAAPTGAEITRTVLARHAVTSLCATPAQYGELIACDSDASLATLRHCTSTGAPLDRETSLAWRRTSGGLALYEGYGQTETTALVANFRSVALRPGSMGKTVPGWELAIHDEQGVPCPYGTVGRLVVRCVDHTRPPAGLMAGYAGDPIATSRAFAGGWYDTGDLARADEDGYFWWAGRAERGAAHADAFNHGLSAMLSDAG